MPMTLSELLSSPELRLRPQTDVGDLGGEPIKWAAVTELENPAPFLGGGEVVLTTGVRQKTVASQRAFVDAVHRAGALALGFGTGLSHGAVPAAVVRRASEVGLPVFEVPYETPFVAITKMVAEAIAAEHLRRLERLLQGHQQLASALLRGGMQGLLARLSQLLGTDVALWQYGARLHGPERGECDWDVLPVATGFKDRCALHVAEPYPRDGLVDYARGLLSVELANEARLRESARLAAGRVLEDLVRGTIEGQDSLLRLHSIGVSAAAPHSVLLVEAPAAQAKVLRTLPLPPDAAAEGTGALLDGRLAVLLPAADGLPAAQLLDTYLEGAGIAARIGYGGSYAQASGLRWSYFEALEALRHRERINRPARLSLTSLLLAARDVPLGALAAESLGPLESFDAAHGAGLLATLRCYLELNGSAGATAERLGLHRNTVRYRLGQIAELSGFDPTNTADRVQLWLALAARDVL